MLKGSQLRESSVDLVVCKSTLHHLNNLDHSVMEIQRVAQMTRTFFYMNPGVINFIALLGRKLFPTDIHDPSEKPFNPISIKRSVIQEFRS